MSAYNSVSEMTAEGRSARIGWVDQARGIGIFLVVFGHVLGGLQSNTWFGQSAACEFVIKFIYSFHMPLFFFLAGQFAPASLSRGRHDFLAKKLATIAYPYLLWSTVQGSIVVVLSRYVNNPMSWDQVLRIWYAPIMQFWFLYVLFVIHLVYALLGRQRHGTEMFLALCAGLYCLEAAGQNMVAWNVIHSVCSCAIYYAAGTVFSGYGSNRAGSNTPTPVLVVTSLLGYTAVAIAVWAQPEFAPWMHPLVAASGMAATIALGELALRTWAVAPLLRLWGRVSMEIYLAHTIVAAACRVLLEQALHLHEPSINLLVGTMAGIWLPVILALLEQRLGVGWLFVFPRAQVSKVLHAVVARFRKPTLISPS